MRYGLRSRCRLVTSEPLKVRLGIASGLVVVGDLIGEGAAQERGVVGDTPNLAARLQSLAGPDGIVVAESAANSGRCFWSRISARRPWLALLQRRAPGAYWPKARSSAVLRRCALVPPRSSVARRNLICLQRRWQQAQAGEGRVVLISGEPGIVSHG